VRAAHTWRGESTENLCVADMVVESVHEDDPADRGRQPEVAVSELLEKIGEKKGKTTAGGEERRRRENKSNGKRRLICTKNQSALSKLLHPGHALP